MNDQKSNSKVKAFSSDTFFALALILSGCGHSMHIPKPLETIAAKNGTAWERVNEPGFGDNYIINFEAFTQFNKKLYVSGSKGANSIVGGLGGAKLFRLSKSRNRLNSTIPACRALASRRMYG
jgi:hypothetical protein